MTNDNATTFLGGLKFSKNAGILTITGDFNGNSTETSFTYTTNKSADGTNDDMFIFIPSDEDAVTVNAANVFDIVNSSTEDTFTFEADGNSVYKIKLSSIDMSTITGSENELDENTSGVQGLNGIIKGNDGTKAGIDADDTIDASTAHAVTINGNGGQDIITGNL